jgi:hypothetical protein
MIVGHDAMAIANMVAFFTMSINFLVLENWWISQGKRLYH